jgi:hypothetical protein
VFRLETVAHDKDEVEYHYNKIFRIYIRGRFLIRN